MHNEVNIPSKKWKCSILHKRCPFFSAEQTVRRWRSDGGRPQSDLGWLRSLTNHQHPWLARNVLSGQRNIDFKIECVHYFYSLLCTPLGQCAEGLWTLLLSLWCPSPPSCTIVHPSLVSFSFSHPLGNLGVCSAASFYQIPLEVASDDLWWRPRSPHVGIFQSSSSKYLQCRKYL